MGYLTEVDGVGLFERFGKANMLKPLTFPIEG